MDKQLQTAVRENNPTELFKIYSRAGENEKARESFFRSGRSLPLGVRVTSFNVNVKTYPLVKYCNSYEELIELLYILTPKIERDSFILTATLEIEMFNVRVNYAFSNQEKMALLRAVEAKYPDFSSRLREAIEYEEFILNNLDSLAQRASNISNLSFEELAQGTPFDFLLLEINKIAAYYSYDKLLSDIKYFFLQEGKIKTGAMKIWKEQIIGVQK